MTWKQPSEPVGAEGEYVYGDDCLGDDVNDFVIQHDSGTNGLVWVDVPRKGEQRKVTEGVDTYPMGEVEDMEVKNAKKNITGSCTITELHPEASLQFRVVSVSQKHGLGPASLPILRCPAKAASSLYKIDM